MADEKQPAKKVVKRVVKKTVVRPLASGPAARPVSRAGRPATPRATAATKPAPKVAAKVAAKSAPKKTVNRPKVEVGAKVGAAASGAASGLSRAAGTAWRGARTRGGAGVQAVRGWRVPQVHPLLATAVTGALAGLLSVVLGVAAKALFSQLRGVPAGGGAWGSLAVVVVVALTVVVSGRLLTALGAPHGALTGLLGALLTIICVLAFFLEPADSSWAVLLFPVLGALTYAAAYLMLEQADKMPKRPE